MPTSFLDHPTPIAFAHRGGTSRFPENSMRAFEHAVGLGYAYLETDAHATADGVLVAFHDKTLDRVTDRAGAIASLPAKQVAAAKIAGTDPIPLLEDLLAAWPDVRFNIDVKDAPAARPLAELVRKMGVWDRICITSFSAARLRVTRQLLDRPVCMATSPVGAAALRSGVPGRALAPAFSRRSVQCAQLPISLATGPLIARAHEAGLVVHVWTVNDAETMNSLLDLGADGIMTDQTELLRKVMIDRGQWNPRTEPGNPRAGAAESEAGGEESGPEPGPARPELPLQ
ncbi:MAG TPA: glycerophosphodiester phosphodiesterase [Streptosporangiaceae bacterium]|nr:glycerophosphodiester phosphodiesterase [Streptosporangiaceae bacterium]